jgi:alkanesulfonate monooxygenase SsuD/methylene tetrahydromethanopterin reductase-like flavin-dependent oxidoreductase (luciferase family)
MILSASIAGFGFHPAATGDARHLVQVDYYRRLVQAAERARLDFVLLDDARALPEGRCHGRLDALTVLSRLAPETRSIGLAVSKPTTYSEPFHVSREVATLDFVSGGRASWHPGTTASAAEARNFGHDQPLPAAVRHAIAEEFVAVSRKLWDSWEDDAVIVDRRRGLYIDPHKLHHIDHVGRHFRIRGPQITYRPPQGHVVVIQIAGDHDGEPHTAIAADVLILHDTTLEAARDAYARHQAQAASVHHTLRVLQAVMPVIGATDAAAQARADALDARAADGDRVRGLRLVGTPAHIADELVRWFRSGAADGFHLLPAELPADMDEYAGLLVPELQRRGAFRTAYAGRTLREHLQLPRPASQFAGAPSEAHTAYHG